MLDPKVLDDLARRLADSVPQGVRHLQADLDRNFRATLQSALGRLDLVTREEFDVQSAVLARTRQMLEEMQERVAQLEAGLEAKVAPKKSTTRRKGAAKPTGSES
jgi:BMFP domain-containing protein YqiC